MEGLSEVRARIGELDAQLRQLRPAAAPGVSFAETLRAAQDPITTGSPRPAGAGAGVARAAPLATFPMSTSAFPMSPSGTFPLSTGTFPLSTGTERGQLLAGGVPSDLARYANGQIPADALRSLGGGQSLWTPAAQAYQQMERAATDAGVRLGITDSYRSLTEQQDVAARKGLYSQGGLAAAPGTSDHGWGRSLDLRLDAGAQAWMRQNASQYGFAENVPREPWHWTYSP